MLPLSLRSLAGWSLASCLALAGGRAALLPSLDLSLDGATSLAGAAEGGTSLHGLALAGLTWESGDAAATASAPAALEWTGHVSVLALAGDGPSGKFLGDFLTVSNSEGFESLRLYAWWLEGRRATVSLRAGALLADDEFAGTEAGGALVNASFGWPAFISSNVLNTGPAFFAAAPGVRVAWSPTDRFTWQTGVYDGDSFDSAAGDPRINRDGLHLTLARDQGAFVISEIHYRPGAAWLLKAGAWWHTADFADQRRDAAGAPWALSGEAPAEHSGNHGAYAVLERALAGTPGHPGAITAHLRGGLAPADRSTIAWAADAGVAWQGPFPGRPDDQLALGISRAAFSSDLAATAAHLDPASPAPDYEQVIELSYHWAVHPHLTVQPDLQWARHPGGSAAFDDAVTFLVRVSASF